MSELVVNAADMIGPTVTVGTPRELTMITVGENQLYIIANKQAAALKYEAVNVGGADVKMSTVEGFAWSNFRDRLMSFPELEITEYLDAYCSCLADCREECTCGHW